MIFLLSKALQPLGAYVAVIIFTLAALTDTVDGYVARFQRQVTVLGQFLDPVADKLLISAALISLVELGDLAGWVAVVIIAREFAVSGLRLVALAENKVITASLLGKTKTVSQVLAVIAIIVNPPLLVWGYSLGWILMALAIVLTIISGIEYFVRARQVLKLVPLSKAER